jgi:hypothetical protein
MHAQRHTLKHLSTHRDIPNDRRSSERNEIRSEDSEGDGSNDAVLETRPKLHWTHIATTLSWADAADVVMRDLVCTQCNGYNLRKRGDFNRRERGGFQTRKPRTG